LAEVAIGSHDLYRWKSGPFCVLKTRPSFVMYNAH